MDQCFHCTKRGDIAGCEMTECSIHETWYVQQLKNTEPDAGRCTCWYDGCLCTFRDDAGGCNC